jgi:NADPH:quinone reductase-like Zn-dependent oxidoreductase
MEWRVVRLTVAAYPSIARWPREYKFNQAAITATIQMMNAIRSHQRGGAETLVYEQGARPSPGPGEVLVAVKAAAITPAELTWGPTWTNRKGESRLPIIPSHEISGVVAEVGPDAAGVEQGQEVYGLIDFYRDGGAAEFVAVKAEELALKPRTLDHVHAAAMPLSALTAWQAFRVRAALHSGQRVLVHGSAGGVGCYAVQLAKYFGAETIATCSEQNAEFVQKLGADRVIEYDRASFDQSVENADLVLDTVGGDTLERSWKVIRRGGTLLSIVAEPSQDRAAGLGVKAAFFIVEPSRPQLVELARLVDRGDLLPIVSQTFPLAAAREAFAAASRGHLRGKIVLEIA